MFKKTQLCTAVLAAMAGSVYAQDAQQQTAPAVQRVEITGSAIRRVNSETALPVQVVNREQIKATGATSVVDLLQRLSVSQNATNEASSVGGGTFGFSGISIHDVGETRTLVLLNGRRLSQFGGQTLTGFAAGFDLNALPVSAIERVEVLTDGASALYGADAVAGVVNFITKRDVTDGEVSIGYSSPSGGAKEFRISATKGFGSVEDDGFNVVMSVAHDQRTKLNASDRSFAKTGNLVFQKDGKIYRQQNYSLSSIPANIINDEGLVVNPYLMTNGACPESTFRVTDADGNDFCGFDYVSTLEIYPERKRDSFMATSTFKLGSDFRLNADLLLSRTQQISRIAPVPGAIWIDNTSDFWATYLAPLGITGEADGGTIAYYRIADLGKRTSNDKSEFFDFGLSLYGPVADWETTSELSYSRSTVKGSNVGYPGALAVRGLTGSGLLNPFVLTGQQTPEAQAALNAINYNGYFDGGVASLLSASTRGSHSIGKLDGGDMMLALGLSAMRENFESKPSLFAQGLLANPTTGELCDPANGKPCDTRFGDASKAIPYTASRTTLGLFGEVEAPLTKQLTMTGSLRYDHTSDFGNATTGKLSMKFKPDNEVLFRGSIGTGFKAPSVPQVQASPQKYGVTAGRYTCSAEMLQIATSLGAACRPGSAQYDVIAAGNTNLQPERSQQATFGIVLDPAPNLSVIADFWWIKIKDSIGQYSESDVFAAPLSYPDSWTTYTDAATGQKLLAFYNPNRNLGKEYRSGIDFDITGRLDLDFGKLTSNLKASYVLRSELENLVTQSYDSSLGVKQGSVTYRWQGAWANTLKNGAWSHTATVNFKSGYKDLPTEDVEVLDASGNVTGYETVNMDIGAYVTLDLQTRWDITEAMAVRLGMLNVFNRKPPFTLNGVGGQQAGYDSAYYDARGRTLYADFTYKF